MKIIIKAIDIIIILAKVMNITMAMDIIIIMVITLDNFAVVVRVALVSFSDYS